ncbi:tripartite tricarboxylate transporter TctB family protein [Paraburkholderia sp. Ac-20342]|uniref:tripartite tricarboxylate transporter TctB family protein n=1 Tax=Paraburkholderia sp. Ac-20342 TaxID=2703889 RepID=UPI0019811DA6|nr:tripartite tricarboxylate transporter TctB family protein [Paraburkholderia sp. Ac-20342]MBN3851413.1 tripartite tricarboxylate transporter TctB family protein [Paraburkholderia sp. Ac-20342]
MDQRRAAVAGEHRFHIDYYGGGLMLLIGLGAAYVGAGYGTGDLRHMGPGFFPVAVGAVLALMGALIALGARGQPDEGSNTSRVEWRGWICIILGVIAFIVVGRYGGLMPATFAVVFVSALGDRDNSIVHAAELAFAMCVVCAAVFWWALQLQFPLFTWGG